MGSAAVLAFLSVCMCKCLPAALWRKFLAAYQESLKFSRACYEVHLALGHSGQAAQDVCDIVDHPLKY